MQPYTHTFLQHCVYLRFSNTQIHTENSLRQHTQIPVHGNTQGLYAFACKHINDFC